MHFQQGTFEVANVDTAIRECWDRGAYVLPGYGSVSIVAPAGIFADCREFLTGKPQDANANEARNPEFPPPPGAEGNG